MKILKLTFKNINNLKGKHEISFNQSPLSNAGIFAIVGPTGSGKSTILDVVTLALFNKIPRFKNASNNEVVISKKQIQDHGSIMTLHTDESYAAIEYEINNITYTSEWTLSKARTGNLKDYEMHIYDANGRPLDLKKSEVPSKNEQIIGLSYKQFVKSIILSQGEFSKFLKADKNERGRLLENITGTSIYRKIGIAAFEKEKVAREAIDKARELVGVIEVLSDQELKESEELSSNSKKEKEAIDKQLKSLYELQEAKDQLSTKRQKLSEKNEQASNLAEKQLALAPFLKKLSIHEKLSPVQGKIAIYKEAINNKQITNENLTSYKTSLKQSVDQLEIVINEMALLTKSKVDQSNFKNIMSVFEKEINDLDRDLKELKNKGSEERNRSVSKSKNYPITLHSIPQEASKQLQNREMELQSILSLANLKSTSEISSLKNQLKSQRETVILLQDIHRETDVLSSVRTKYEETKKLITQYESQASKLLPKLSSAKEIASLQKEKVQLLLKQKSDAERIERLEDIRGHLAVGQPCPLCGALDHPYSDHAPDQSSSEIKTSIDKAQNKLSEKETKVSELEKQSAETKASISITNEQIQSLNFQQSELAKNINDLVGKYKGTDKIDNENLHETLIQSQKKVNQLEDGINALQEIALNKELQGIFDSLNSLMTEYRAKNTERQKKYQGIDITVQCNHLQDRYASSKTSIERLKVSIEKENADLARANNLVINIDNELTPQITALGFNNLTDASSSFLTKEEVERIRENKEELTKLLTTNQTEISNLQKEIKIISKKDSKAGVSLDQLKVKITELEKQRDQFSEQIGQIDSRLKRDQEDRSKIKEKEKEIGLLSEEYKKWSLMKKLIGDANGNTFANFAQGLTLQNLLVYANRRLENLSDRYLLDMPKQEDVLNVVDLYQGNIRRAVSTLSGGESFLISLALALSLSDMASKNIALDSLFIDEGFGTLDQETLDVAINTLEKLQSESQKTVGVISHVAALKERINVQIVLNKNAQGYSEIEIIS